MAALSDVDYGKFVDQIRKVVEPVLAAYRQRDRVLQSLHAKGKHLRQSRVYIIATGLAGSQATPSDSIKLLGRLLGEAGARVRYLALDKLPRDAQGQPVISAPLAKRLKAGDALVMAGTDHTGDRAVQAALAPAAPTLVDLRRPAPAAGPPDVLAKYTGIVPLVYKTQRQLLISLRESIAWAFGLIAVVMMFVLRSPTAGLVAMIPNIFPIVVVFGAMGWLGIKVDIGIMMTASVALGVAVDDTIHYLFWFRRGLGQGRDRHGAAMLAYERCSRAMFQTTLIGGFGLSVFAFSTFTPTQQFGILMITLLAAALVGDLLILPAILAGPVGKFFCRRLHAEPADDETPAADAPASSFGQPHRPPARQRYDTPHRSINA